MGEIQGTIATRPATKTIEENGRLRESQAVGLHESKVGRDKGRSKQGKVASGRQEKSSLQGMILDADWNEQPGPRNQLCLVQLTAIGTTDIQWRLESRDTVAGPNARNGAGFRR